MQNDISHYFPRDDKADRVVIPNNVKLVVGTKVYNCNGCVLAQRSTVFLDKMQKQAEIYLDEFTGCQAGVMDSIDLLYGAEITLMLENIQPLLKFSLMYKIEGMFDLCMDWVQKEMTIGNLFRFYKIGQFVKSIDVERDDILTCCEDVLLMTPSEDLVKVSESWRDDVDFVSFMFDKQLLPTTLPVINAWIDSEEKVVIALASMDDDQFENVPGTLQTQAMKMTAKMNEYCNSVPSLKRVIRLQTKIGSAAFADEELQEPARKRLCLDSKPGYISTLGNGAWRRFDLDRILHDVRDKMEHFHYTEILLDWIYHVEPNQEVVTMLWNIMSDVKRANYEYVEAMRNFLKVTTVYVIPAIERKEFCQYTDKLGPFDDSHEIKDVFDRQNIEDHALWMDWDVCLINGCCETSDHTIGLKLRDAIPCYELGVEGRCGRHYHHEKIKHFYATKEVEGKRVLVSFVTKSLAEVLDEMIDATAIEINYLCEH